MRRRLQQQQRQPAPVRVTVDGELAATVYSEPGAIAIRQEPGWKIAETKISVEMKRVRTRRSKEPPCSSDTRSR